MKNFAKQLGYNLEDSNIQKKLADPNTLGLLKDVMAKLG